MKRLGDILIITLITIGCNQSNEKSKIDNGFTDSINFEGTPNYIEKLENKFKDVEEFFPYQHLGKFDCSLIEEHIIQDSLELTRIDSINCKKVFGDYKNDFGSFNNGYWISFEGHIHDFYPITVLQYIGVVERPLVMVLFDRHGKVINSFPVADFYGESGGCLTSEFSNDSTLVQSYEWYEFGIDPITGKETQSVEYRTQSLTIFSSGNIEISEIKSWKE